MGAHIGVEYALAGCDVVLITRTPASVSGARQRAMSALEGLVRHRLISASSAKSASRRLTITSDFQLGNEKAQLIVESAPESFSTKVDLLGRAGRVAPRAIITTNTSSLSIDELGQAADISTRFVGTHYWNTPTLLPLVEVIPCSRATPATVRSVMRNLRRVGKEPVLVKDYPGFAWNRLQFALLREAAHLVAKGVVDQEAIDRIVRRGLARRWSAVGPFETMALGGQETFVTVARLLFPRLSMANGTDELEAVAVPRPGPKLRAMASARDAELARWRRRDLVATPGKPIQGDLGRARSVARPPTISGQAAIGRRGN